MKSHALDEQISHSILTQLDSIDRGMAALRDRVSTLSEQQSEILAAITGLKSPAAQSEPQEFLTCKQAATYLNVSESTVRKMKHLHVKRGKSVRLRRSALDRVFRVDPLAVARPAKRKKS